MASSKKYTVVVAGCGKRGMHHAEAFLKNGRFELVGLCDINPERLEAATKQCGNPATSLEAEPLLNSTRPDVFCFCTLPNIRLEMIRMGVKAGVHLMAYEKPIATSTNEALEMMSLLRQSGIKSVVSHQHRYGEHYKKVREIIASGAIGRVHTVYGTATGWMLHMLTHLIDYIRWFNDNAEAEWVVGQASGKGKFGDNHPSPDYIAGLVQFANGVRGIVESGDGAPDIPEVDAWWRKCRIGAQGTGGFAEVLTGGGWRAVTRDSGGVISGTGNMDYAHDMPPYIQQIVDWLDDPAKVHPCNGESAYKGFEIMMALCRSVVARGKIKLPLGPGQHELETLASALPD
jgi:predicted dehydrogenase